DKGDIIISVPVLLELNKVLSRKKFDRYLLDQERKAFLALLFKEAELKETFEKIQVCREPKDDKYLELAASGDAKYIITGDQDLLVLNPFRQISILTPEQFLALDLQ
ncbi:MAG: putative toxin-antitoxin system toxin component, PIN family, partial [bacterium]